MKKLLSYLVIACIFSNQISFAYSGEDKNSSLVKKLVTSQLKAKYNSLSNDDKEKLVNELDDNLNKIYEKLDSISEKEFASAINKSVNELQNIDQKAAAKQLISKLPEEEKKQLLANQIDDQESFLLNSDSDKTLEYTITSELVEQNRLIITKLKQESLESLKLKIIESKKKLKEEGFKKLTIIIAAIGLSLLLLLTGVIVLTFGIAMLGQTAIFVGAGFIGTTMVGTSIFVGLYW